MHRDPDQPLEVRFEVIVAGNDYQKLMAHFRGRDTTAPALPKQVRALIDVDPTCRHFTVTRVGKHKLPKALSIRPGSGTHKSLTQAISAELRQRLYNNQINPLLAKHLQQIIDLCPDVVPAPLHFSPHDLELTDSPTSTIQISQTHLAISTLATLAPSILLDIDDSPTLILPSEIDPSHQGVLEVLEKALERCPPLLTQVSGNIVELHHSILMPPLPEGIEVEFFIHWGSYEELAPVWSDELVGTVATSCATTQFPLYHRMHVPIQGWYGATLFARLKNGATPIWIGTPGIRDARFRIAQDDSPSTTEYHHGKRQHAIDAYSALQAVLTNPSSALEVFERFPEQYPDLSLGGSFAQVILDNHEDEQSAIDGLSLSHQAISRLATSYGIQELVFVSPEGPHAAAGGLAQVISGLPKELARLGIPVSIITPLFRYDNGNKHAAAESVLAHGISIDSERVLPQCVATVAIPLGPTYHTGTSWTKRQPSTIECKVYLAQKGNIRFFFLTNSSIFDRLYQPVLADEQLRRAIIFSRAALETIACEQLMLRPSAIISNDWLTACVPAFATLDPRYNAVPWIRHSKTIHMIHNGGADYHGRLPVNYNHEDLWPLFNLSPDHYFGFCDLHNRTLLNLTAAAAQHATGGVVTVSQPYAQQLVTPGGGDGLEHLLRPKQTCVYGVSNGINRSDIDAWISLRVGLSPLQKCRASDMIRAKRTLRCEIQERFGLQVNPEMQLLTFVGRLAEQKGLSLLSGFVEHTRHSTLEDILIRHPNTQIIIAGPVTHDDNEASALCNTVRYLVQRYPGRVASALDYVSHSTALELIAASTLFLMPSRFEPGGITQLEALAMGTPVVGRSVGGIKATIINYDSGDGTGTGFLCDDYTPTAFANTLHWALGTCNNPVQYEKIVQQALDAKHSWVDRAPTFAAVVQRLILGETRARSLPILEHQNKLAHSASV